MAERPILLIMCPISEEQDSNADRPAAAVQMQWEDAAGERGLAGADPIQVTWGRPSVPMAGPLAAAAGSHRFDPLPGLAATGQAQLAAGQIGEDFHAVYGGLGSGRLVIAGPPGSGKSSAAVLLILEGLRYRDRVASDDKPKVPVPVLVTAQDWDPRHQPVADWLSRRLQETYPLFTGAAGAANAAGLIAAGKIAVIIDGLDEIAADLRPVALQALSQQASFRVVVLSRTAEMASAASHQGVLRGAAAIELRAIGPADAASYLERVQLDPPPDGWRDLIDRIRVPPASPLSKALNNPLTLTLVRDTYQSGEDTRELLEFCDITLHGIPEDQAAEAITDHLLNRVLPAAYAPARPAAIVLRPAHGAERPHQDRRPHEPGRHPRPSMVAHSHMGPGYPARSPVLLVGLVSGLVVGVVVGLLVGLAVGVAVWLPTPVGTGLVAGVQSGLVVGVVVGLVAGLVVGFLSLGGAPPRRTGKLRLHKALKRENLVGGLRRAFVSGVVSGVAVEVADGVADRSTRPESCPGSGTGSRPGSGWESGPDSSGGLAERAEGRTRRRSR